MPMCGLANYTFVYNSLTVVRSMDESPNGTDDRTHAYEEQICSIGHQCSGIAIATLFLFYLAQLLNAKVSSQRPDFTIQDTGTFRLHRGCQNVVHIEGD